MNRSLRDQLKEWQRNNPIKRKPRRQNPEKQKSERLSESDIKSLMGINKRGLRRGKGGAWK